MKKKKSFIMAVLLSLVTLVMAIAPAMAQTGDGTAARPEHRIRDGLALIVPVAARTGQPVTMTVLQRSDATPAEGAGIWAFTPEQADSLEEQLTAMRESGALEPADTDWEAIVSVYGIFLGRTDARGKLTNTFTEGGRYRLLTVKRGYIPGRAGIFIGTAPDALAIRAPQQAEPGEPVSLTVYQRDNGQPVEGAGVWAFTREMAEALKAETDAMRESGAINADTDWESFFNVRGIFLGRTGENGELVTGFAEEGGYLLIAAKPGFRPARTGIRIGKRPDFLAMEVQRWTRVNEVVPIHVFERDSGEPAGGASVFALTRKNAAALRQEMTALREAGNSSPAETDWEAVVSVRGSYLGTTDERGYLETAFGEPGGYVLVTVKRGHIPGYAFIVVRAPRPEVTDRENGPFRNGGNTGEPGGAPTEDTK